MLLNKKNELVAVVIPCYRSTLTELEQISLQQVRKILQHYDLYLVLPESLNLTFEHTGISEVRFADYNFQGIGAYNNLMLDKQFYERFGSYEYILIYQLDAFVFSDKLTHFCKLGYDYIGAPWINGVVHYKDSRHSVWEVGNGGFSLRNVKNTIKVLEERKQELKEWRKNEDLFFATVAGEHFKVPSKEVALQFSFEMEVQECFCLNGDKLPFGCHAWGRFDLAFWKPYIEEFGYKIDEKYVKQGAEDFVYVEQYLLGKQFSDFWKNDYDVGMLKDSLEKVLENANKPYAVWGAGYWGSMLPAMLDDCGYDIRLVIDNSLPLQGKQLAGITITDSITFQRRAREYNVVIAMKNGKEAVAKQLQEMGLSYKKDYIFLQDIEVLVQHIIM